MDQYPKNNTHDHIQYTRSEYVEFKPEEKN